MEGKPPGSSASCIIASSMSGYHILKIHGYSRTKETPTGESIRSRPFTVGDYSWYIAYYPNGDDADSADYISFYLFLDQDDEEDTVTVKAQFTFRFFNEQQQAPSWASERIDEFKSGKGWGWPTFIGIEDFEQSKHLRDDSFTIRCDINIINHLRTEEMPTFVSVPPSDLHHHLGDLLRTGKGADVAFEAGGETFRAHGYVLASRSPVFAAELFGPLKESHGGAIRIEDMDARVFRALLRFLYTDSLPEMWNEGEEDAMAQHLLVAADRYAMGRLKLICEDKLCRRLEARNVATILALAEQHHCHGLKKACFNFLSSSPVNLLTAVLASDGFKHLGASCPSVINELIAKMNS